MLTASSGVTVYCTGIQANTTPRDKFESQFSPKSALKGRTKRKCRHASLGVCTLPVVEKLTFRSTFEGVCNPACYMRYGVSPTWSSSDTKLCIYGHLPTQKDRVADALCCKCPCFFFVPLPCEVQNEGSLTWQARVVFFTAAGLTIRTPLVRLETDAWSMIKCLRKQHMTTPSPLPGR